MQTIRQSVFETNSSSTHSVTVLTEDQFKDFKAGKSLIDENGKIVPVTRENIEEGAQDYAEYISEEEEEVNEQKFTLPSGEKVVVVCKYGYS